MSAAAERWALAGDVTLEINIFKEDRPKGRKPVWRCRVFDSNQKIFDDAWISVRLVEDPAARWLAEVVARAYSAGNYLRPVGHRGGDEQSIASWQGDLGDDCTGVIGDCRAHVEHLEGPRHGGRWYCQVYDVFHSSEPHGLEIMRGDAARWLCELVAQSLPETPEDGAG